MLLYVKIRCLTKKQSNIELLRSSLKDRNLMSNKVIIESNTNFY